jgi:hypothetical protein
MHCIKPIRLAVALALPIVCPAAWAQGPHQKSFDEYVLRSSVVSSMSISEASAATHGIERAHDRAILNVTVLKKGSNLTETVPARVEATAVNLAGYRRLIRMAETTADGWTSYTGTFKFAPREVLDFKITAQPVGSDKRLGISYREQLWPDRKTP